MSIVEQAVNSLLMSTENNRCMSFRIVPQIEAPVKVTLTFAEETGAAGYENIAVVVERLDGRHALLIHDHGSIAIRQMSDRGRRYRLGHCFRCHFSRLNSLNSAVYDSLTGKKVVCAQ